MNQSTKVGDSSRVTDGGLAKDTKHLNYGTGQEEAYYDRSLKPSFRGGKGANRIYNNCCALEHDKQFVKKTREAQRAMKKLFFVAMICFVFMGCEFAGGILSRSLAILTDAAHMFSDVAGFMISFFSIYVANKPASATYSMGYHRAEILGAYVSIFVIWGLLIFLNYEAYYRLTHT